MEEGGRGVAFFKRQNFGGITTYTVADYANQFSVFSCPTFTIGLVRVPKTLTF